VHRGCIGDPARLTRSLRSGERDRTLVISRLRRGGRRADRWPR
jgi:hypothetical protein